MLRLDGLLLLTILGVFIFLSKSVYMAKLDELEKNLIFNQNEGKTFLY
jgi:hypothetical protein